MSLYSDLNEVLTPYAQRIKGLITSLGNLSNLETTDKSSIVAAINEAAQSGGTEVIIDDTLTQSGQAADAKAAGDAISQLSADLEYDSKKLLQFINKGSDVIRWDLIYGYWDIQSGELTFHTANNKQFVTSKYPIKVEAGDVIHLLDTVSSRFFAVYSATLNPAEWESLVPTTNHDVTIPNAGYVLISVRNEPYSAAFADADINTFFDERLLIVKSNFSTRTTELLANSDILNGILANNNGYKQEYITNDEQTLTINVVPGIIVPCVEGDSLVINSQLSLVSYPEYFATVALGIREQNSQGVTIKRIDIADLSDSINYVVSKSATVRVGFVFILTKASAQSVQTGYYETVNYSLAVKKAESSNELDSVCTEAGDTWEV